MKTDNEQSGADSMSGFDRKRAGFRMALALFGPLQRATLSGWRRIVLLIGLILIGMAISLARTPKSTWNILWAEDGAVFVSDALQQGPGVLFAGYAGYMHLLPRLATEVVVLLPLEIVPVGVTILAALLTGLIACACFVFLETRIASLELRLAAWVSCLALPIMGGEISNNFANLHWYLLIAAFCASVVRSRSRAMVLLQSVVLFFAVTSDALALLLLPILLFRWWVYAEGRDRVPTLAFLIGAVVQVVVVALSIVAGAGRPPAQGRPGVSELLDLYTFRVVLNALFGVTFPAQLIEAFGSALPGLALAVVVAAIVAAAIVDPERRAGIIAFGGASLAFALIVFTLQWDGFARSGLLDFFTGGRYAVVPVSLLLLAVILSADVLVERMTVGWLRHTVASLVLIAILVPSAVDFRAANVRAGATSWVNGLDAAAAACERTPGEDLANVGLAPSWFGGMIVPCSAISP